MRPNPQRVAQRYAAAHWPISVTVRHPTPYQQDYDKVEDLAKKHNGDVTDAGVDNAVTYHYSTVHFRHPGDAEDFIRAARRKNGE